MTRRANHTITDVTGRGKAGPGVIGGGLPPPRRRAAADGWGVGENRSVAQRAGLVGWSGTFCGSGLPAGQGEGEAAAGEHRHGDQRLG